MVNPSREVCCHAIGYDRYVRVQFQLPDTRGLNLRQRVHHGSWAKQGTLYKPQVHALPDRLLAQSNGVKAASQREQKWNAMSLCDLARDETRVVPKLVDVDEIDLPNASQKTR